MNEPQVLLAKFDEVTVFGDGTTTQKRWLQQVPELIERAHQVFGVELPHVEFYFYSNQAKFRTGYIEVTGYSKFWTWQSGAGFYRDGCGRALISEKTFSSKANPFGLVMHEYGHALTQHLTQQHRLPTWLAEGFSDYLSRPWCENLFESAPAQIRRCAEINRVATFKSFAQSVYSKPESGYAIARLMVLELLRGLPETAIADILKQAQNRNGAYSKIVREITKLTPKQLYEKVLLDCGVDNTELERQRKIYWKPWGTRRETPTTLRDCVIDLYSWKQQNYGARFREIDVDQNLYPQWKQLAQAFAETFRSTQLKKLNRTEFHWIDAVQRLDRGFNLFSYLSPDEINSMLCQQVPVDLAEYFGECIEQLVAEVRGIVRSRFCEYVNKVPPTIRKNAGDAFLVEFDRFWTYAASTNETEFAKYNRWTRLARSFEKLVNWKPVPKWINTVLWSVKLVAQKDSERRMLALLTKEQVEEILSRDCPEFLSEYLLPHSTQASGTTTGARDV